MTIIEFPTTLTGLTTLDYVTQQHDCDENGFDPIECVPCAGCDHAECRHPSAGLPKPIDITGMTPAQIVDARRAEYYALNAALTASPCDVNGCDCTRMKAGDECERCGGAGSVDDNYDRTHECNGCAGTGVVA